VKRGTFPSRLRVLTERDGLPPLPAADICLHRSANLSRAGTLLADHLRLMISAETSLPYKPRNAVRRTRPSERVDHS
jgi:hypothetical protein